MKKTLFTPAKINLFLKVTRKRPDNYHELLTLFLPLPDLGDEITLDFDTVPGISVSCDQPDVPLNQDNICTKAAQKYAEQCNLMPAWHIHIVKHIPIAAGLGGGSSDAAAVLRILNEHFHSLAAADLNALAAQIGADVPFFLNPEAIIASGIGEVFMKLGQHLPTPPIILVNPHFPVSAAWCYRHLKAEEISKANVEDLSCLITAATQKNYAALGKLIHNDLAAANFQKFPLLQIIRDFLLEQGASGVEISGSGPTIFAVAPNFAALPRMVTACREKFPDCLIFCTQPDNE